VHLFYLAVFHPMSFYVSLYAFCFGWREVELQSPNMSVVGKIVFRSPDFIVCFFVFYGMFREVLMHFFARIMKKCSPRTSNPTT
jgi:hypothetical protein